MRSNERLDLFQPHSLQAFRQAVVQRGFDLSRLWRTQPAFCGNAHAVGQAALEFGANDPFGFALAIGRRQIEQGDAAIHCRAGNGDAFLARGFAP